MNHMSWRFPRFAHKPASFPSPPPFLHPLSSQTQLSQRSQALNQQSCQAKNNLDNPDNPARALPITPTKLTAAVPMIRYVCISSLCFPSFSLLLPPLAVTSKLTIYEGNHYDNRSTPSGNAYHYSNNGTFPPRLVRVHPLTFRRWLLLLCQW